MSKKLQVLIVEDSEDDVILLLHQFKKGGYEVTYKQVYTAADMINALDEQTWDVIVSDYVMPQFSGLDALKIVQDKGLDLPFIIVSGKIGEETAVKAMKAGAHDYITKKNMTRLVPAIEREIREASERRKHKQTDEKLRLSEEKFYKAFNASPLPMAITTLKSGEIVDANKAFYDLVMPDDELITKSIYDIVLWEDPQQRIAPIQQILNTKMPVYNKEISFKNASGALCTGLYSADIITASGKQCVLVIINDITELRNYERKIARLDRLNLVGEMAASIGHEIRNPMTSVRGFLQLLAGKKECTKYQDYFDLMINELDRANSIINEFLSLAKDKPVEMQSKNLNAIVENIFPLIQADAMESNKYIDLDLEEIPSLPLDEKEIRQLLLNLVRNGLEAMPAGKKITIKTYQNNQEVVLAVQDEGSGIDREVLNKLGTPFLTTKENGTGLGLPICFSIANRHNASIKIDSGPQGTTFYICFAKTTQ